MAAPDPTPVPDGGRPQQTSTTAPRIVVAPEPVRSWVRAEVEAGGGVVVRSPEQADALVWTDPFEVDVLRLVLEDGPGIRWVQLPWAGVEDFAAAGLFRDGRTWTCGKGVYAEPVAEHALAMALYGLRHLGERTVARSWGGQAGRTLVNGRVTILGAGGIAEWLLRLLAPFEVEATLVRRQAQPLAGGAEALDGAGGPGGGAGGPGDRLYQGMRVRTMTVDRLHDALERADVVFLALALTPETEGIVAQAELDVMQPHAWLVNVARGKHVVTADLVRALQERRIGGAALDVTDPEPLPDGHPLWDLPNCLVTPHTANTAEMAQPLLGARIRENVRRFCRGEQLIGLVDPDLGY